MLSSRLAAQSTRGEYDKPQSDGVLPAGSGRIDEVTSFVGRIPAASNAMPPFWPNS
jgi:hypothetical protein